MNNGKKVPISIDISIPYFEDVRIEYYKQCGYHVDTQEVHSTLFWVMVLLLIVGAIYLGFVAYKYCFKADRGIDAFPGGHFAASLIDYIKGKAHSGYQPGPFERELPDIDESSSGSLTGKDSAPRAMVKLEATTYGSI